VAHEFLDGAAGLVSAKRKALFKVPGRLLHAKVDSELNRWFFEKNLGDISAPSGRPVSTPRAMRSATRERWDVELSRT
jgi:hypothetical protein